MFAHRSVLLALAAATAVQSSGVSFDAPRDYLVDANALAIADFDKDGNQDVVSATNRIFLLLGGSDGTLQDPVQLAGVAGPVTALVAGDFNGDTNPDLAAAVYANPGVVSIRLGLGDGSFAAPTDYPVPSPPTDVVAGDFDGDGIADLASAHPDLAAGALFKGVGDGTFEAAVSVALGGGPEKFVTGDFNGDGLHDLGVSEWFGSVHVFVSNGSGAFSHTWTLDPDPGAEEQLNAGPPADYDKDGAVDLLAVVECCGGGVYLFRGAGDGTFPTSVKVLAERVDAIAVADFDSDLKVDIAALDSFAANVAILSGNDDGTFTETARNEMGVAGATSIAAADFNRDSNMDLAITTVDLALLQVRMGKGDGTFRTVTILDNEMVATNWIVSADFDRDGRPDIAAAQGGSTSWIALFRGNGDGTFAPKLTVPVPEVTHSALTADVNGDTFLDLVLLSGEDFLHTADDVWVYLGNGNGTFQTGMFFSTGDNPSSAALADFDGDSVLDLAVANAGLNVRRRPSLVMLRGLGGGVFASPTPIDGVVLPSGVVSADFNADGRPDLGVSTTTRSSEFPSAIAILLNDGAGSFQPSYVPFRSPWTAGAILPGHLNGDSRTDLLVRSRVSPSGGPPEHRRSLLLVLLGAGNGAFELAGHHVIGGSVSGNVPVIVDLDGDLVLDIAVGGLSAMHVLTGRGGGTFVPGAIFGLDGDFVGEAVAADFNGDSKPDLAVVNELRRRRVPEGGVASVPLIRLLLNTTQ